VKRERKGKAREEAKVLSKAKMEGKSKVAKELNLAIIFFTRL
jgi:hypothetical protein